ncbi:hypothetical protein AHAS_Ahas05G0149400 [Arachis hypogaea]
MEWFLLIVHGRRLFPRSLIISTWILPPSIVPSLMHVLNVVSISYNIVRTTLIAHVMRIHRTRENKNKY